MSSTSTSTDHTNTKKYLAIFIPIGILSGFLLVFIAAGMWWLIARLDERGIIWRRGIPDAQSQRDVEEGRDQQQQEGHEMKETLPKYEGKDVDGLPEYDSTDDGSEGRRSEDETEMATARKARVAEEGEGQGARDMCSSGSTEHIKRPERIAKPAHTARVTPEVVHGHGLRS